MLSLVLALRYRHLGTFSMAQRRQRPLDRDDESASPPSGRSHSFQVCRLTPRRIREWSTHAERPVRLRGSIGGRRICIPGVSNFRNDWKVPGWYVVGGLLGTDVFVVGDDGVVDTRGEFFRVSAVLVAHKNCVAPAAFELRECANEQDFVDVVFGRQVVEFAGMPLEERDSVDYPTSVPDGKRCRR